MSRTPNARNTGAPRWPVLLGLGAGVLVAHLWLLVGEWPSFASHTSAVAGATPGDADRASPRSGGAGTATPPVQPVLPVDVSSVRWITSPPPAPPAHTPPPAPVEPRVEPPSPPAVAVPDVPPETPQIPASEPAEALSVAEPAAPPTASATVASAGGSPGPGTPATPGGGVPLPPAQTVRDTELHYDVEGLIKNIPFHAQGTLQWHRQDNRYDARMELKAFLVGSRVQTSTGLIGPQGLQPERFADRSRSEKAAHFDQANGRIRFSNNAPDAPLMPGAQDRLSIFVQLAARFDARPQDYPPGTTFDIQVAGAGGAELWRFVVESPVEPLNLPAGELPAIKVYRPPRLEYDTALEVWLAPQLHYLPARIRLTQSNGDVADQQLNFVPRVERNP